MRINTLIIIITILLCTTVKCQQLNTERRGFFDSVLAKTIQIGNYIKDKGKSLIIYIFGGDNSAKKVPIDDHNDNVSFTTKFERYTEEAESNGKIVFDVITEGTENNTCDEYAAVNTMTTPQLIAMHGYLSESHTIITSDGYILTVHRIPFSKQSSHKVIPQRTVLLHHGILGSSADWVLQGPEKSLPYLLSDAGYDVWMANVRGNTYSRAHVLYSPSEYAFWNFTFHEVGQQDLPAVIDYIIDMKGNGSKINYIGYSMGTTVLFVLLSTKPEYNSKISSAFAVAPIAYMTNIQEPLKVVSKFTNSLKRTLKLFGANEFLPENAFIRYLSKHACKIARFQEALCELSMFVLCENPSQSHFDRSLMPLIFGHVPAGSSTKTLAHYGQIIQANGTFQHFDYGSLNNLDIYGDEHPPEYPVQNITVPITLFSGKADGLSTLADAKKLYKRLHNPFTHYVIPDITFNHLDFMFAKDADTLVYRELVAQLKLF